MARRSENLDLMAASPGTSRHLVVHAYGAAGARPKAYLQASLRADELPGGLVLHHLMARLDDADVLGEIVIVPAANPIGLGQQILGEHAGRYEATTGVNFNRSYPDLGTRVLERLEGRLGPDAAANVALIRAAMVEVLDDLTPTKEVDQLKLALVRLAIDADIVLDLHCDLEAELHLFLSPELWPAGRDLAAELGAVATLLALDSGGGSFDEVFSLPWHKVRERFGGADVPVAPGTPRTEIRTQITGRLFSRARSRLARPGSSVAKVRGRKPLPDRAGYLLED